MDVLSVLVGLIVGLAIGGTVVFVAMVLVRNGRD